MREVRVLKYAESPRLKGVPGFLDANAVTVGRDVGKAFKKYPDEPPSRGPGMNVPLRTSSPLP